MQEFELRVEPLDNNNFAIALCQRSYKKAGEKCAPQAKQIGKVQGQALVLIRQVIYDVLKANNYDPKTLSNKRQASYVISEEFGVTLAILFKVIQPVSKPDCIVSIARSIAAMSYEEANYWFAMITNGRSNTLKAMRILFST
jgi:hypothetical protein